MTQDKASPPVGQSDVGERWPRAFSIVSSIQLATYSFAPPLGTSVPPIATDHLASNHIASLDDGDVTGSIAPNRVLQTPPRYQASDFPRVDRTLKGDRLVTFRPPSPETVVPPAAPVPEDPSTSNSSVFGAKTVEAPQAPVSSAPAELDAELQEALSAPPLRPYDEASLSVEAQSADDPKPRLASVAASPDDPFSVKTSNLFFGSSSLGGDLESMESWQPGEEPLIVPSDPDMKATVSPSSGNDATESGESVAAKGEVNADNRRTESPAERLGLNDKSRAKSEKCLAEAVYFESRGEAVRGQIAVAQVVMNRVFSGKYPDTVCGVVYQNRHRHYACQFTFACDGIPDVIREPDMWERAQKIAKAMLDGQIWLPEVGKATHYHAYWVRPSWVSEMKRTYKFGVHTFYRPRAWGDGKEEPSWGTPAQTAAISAELRQEAKSSAEMETRRR